MLHPAQRLDHFTLEEVVPIRFEMIEYVLEIIDVPRIRESQRVHRFYENPLGVRRDGGNVLPSEVSRLSPSCALIETRCKRSGTLYISPPVSSRLAFIRPLNPSGGDITQSLERCGNDTCSQLMVGRPVDDR